MTTLGAAIERVLARGRFCHLASRTDRGPHLTPAVFAFWAGSVWATTARGSVKARAWRSDPSVGGLVRDGDDAVSFTGRVRTYDLFDTATWPDALLRSPIVTAASLRFTQKNARFFAGYAVDARRVPFAWTPPNRVFAEIEVEAAALLGRGEVLERAGSWPAPAEPRSPRTGFRSSRVADAFAAVPGHVRSAIGASGAAALALEDEPGPVLVPARWAAGDDRLVASMPRSALGATATAEPVRVALELDRASSWRARRMLGCMVQATADLFDPRTVRSGARSLASALASTGGDPDRDVLARLRPSRVVWWDGWTSGSSRIG
jgi:hypothetical protein